jgi:hypothetical protein
MPCGRGDAAFVASPAGAAERSQSQSRQHGEEARVHVWLHCKGRSNVTRSTHISKATRFPVFRDGYDLAVEGRKHRLWFAPDPRGRLGLGLTGEWGTTGLVW